LLIPGQKNVVNTILVCPETVYLPRLHIKLGVKKKFGKAMDRIKAGLVCLKNKFRKISNAEIKEAVIVGPQV
jgi:hypothetical protein